MTGIQKQSNVHVIRLRDPWECVFSAYDTESGAPGYVLLGRSFGLPTGLNPSDQIDLVLEGICHSTGHVRLNGSLLGEITCGDKPVRFSLNGRLQNRNQLEISLLLGLGWENSSGAKTPVTSIERFIRQVRLEIQAMS